MEKNYYIILGIDLEASNKEIKEAYRKKVQKYHPDHYGPDSSQFILIQEAYNVLGDPVRRKKYDESVSRRKKYYSGYRNQTNKRHPLDIEPLIPESRYHRSNRISLKNSFQNFSPSFSELFDRYWRNFTNLDQPKSERLENLKVEVLINPEDARCGGQVELMISVRIKCPVCIGSGSIGFWECSQCDGFGILESQLPLIVSYPAGIKNQFYKSISLNRYGINNFYLTVIFRVTETID